MLDSKVVPASYRGAIEFNMQSVLAYWQKHQDSNYGLVVLVEDAQGMALPPAMYLQQMNCSGKCLQQNSKQTTTTINHNINKHSLSLPSLQTTKFRCPTWRTSTATASSTRRWSTDRCEPAATPPWT